MNKSNQNHREKNQKCCLICIRLDEIKGCWNVNCPCHSIGSENSVIRKSPIAEDKAVTSEQRILERFEKSFPKETCQYYAGGKIDGYCFDGVIVSQVKTFISASLRTHTRQVLEDFKKKIAYGMNRPNESTVQDYAHNSAVKEVISLLTEEIDKLKWKKGQNHITKGKENGSHQ